MTTRNSGADLGGTHFHTAGEAAAICRYTRASSFLRAFRAAGFETYGTLGKRLIEISDLADFLSHNCTQLHTTDTVPRGT